ncbi:MAG: DUF4139 domain-containing protein [Leadbetterella sp.]
MLKRLFIFLFLISFEGFTQNPISVESQIQKVTVYRGQARIQSMFSVNLPKGKSEIWIEKLLEGVISNTIQIGSNQSVTLLGVNNTLSTKPINYNSRLDSISALKAQIETEEMLLQTTQSEEKILMANANVKSEQDGLTGEELKEVMKVFKQKLLEIGTERIQHQRNIQTLKNRLQTWERGYSNIQDKPNRYIAFKVGSDSDQKVDFTLEYNIYNAGWEPKYDLRLKDEAQKEAQLELQARVWQNTGMDWKNVEVVLSTARPNENSMKPNIEPQFLNVSEVVARASNVRLRKMKMEDAEYEEMAVDSSAVATHSLNLPFTIMTPQPIAIQENVLSTEYILENKYTIPSNQENEMIPVQQNTIQIATSTQAVPKLSLDAYLMAKVMDWRKYNLLSGEISVYFQNKYVGKSYLNASQTEDDFMVSLGVDSRVTLKRENLLSVKKRKFVGNNVKESFEYKITVINRKSIPVELEIEDQLPVSQDSKIEVDIDELSGGVLKDEKTGKVVWNIQIEGNGKVEKLFNFTVKYPKDAVIDNL